MAWTADYKRPLYAGSGSRNVSDNRTLALEIFQRDRNRQRSLANKLVIRPGAGRNLQYVTK